MISSNISRHIRDVRILVSCHKVTKVLRKVLRPLNVTFSQNVPVILLIHNVSEAANPVNMEA
jgi:hypothetical protein